MRLSHAGRYASYGSWKATSALAKGKYRLRSSGGIPRARARRKAFSIVSIAARAGAPREHGMRLKRSSYALVTFGAFEVCNAYCGASKKRPSLIWKSERHVLAVTRTFDPAAQKVAWASKGVRICAPIDAHAWT